MRQASGNRVARDAAVEIHRDQRLVARRVEQAVVHARRQLVGLAERQPAHVVRDVVDAQRERHLLLRRDEHRAARMAVLVQRAPHERAVLGLQVAHRLLAGLQITDREVVRRRLHAGGRVPAGLDVGRRRAQLARGRIPDVELLHRRRRARADREARFEVADVQAHQVVGGVRAVHEAARHQHAGLAGGHVVGDDLAHHPRCLGVGVGEGGDGQRVVVEPGEAARHLHDHGHAGLEDLQRIVHRRGTGRVRRRGRGRRGLGRVGAVAVGVADLALRIDAFLQVGEGRQRDHEGEQREEAGHVGTETIRASAILTPRYDDAVSLFRGGASFQH